MTDSDRVQSPFRYSRRYYGQITTSGKTTHPLTIWDCEPLYRSMTPILGWALRGDVNVERMSNALKLLDTYSMFIYALFSAADTPRLKFKIDIPEASQEQSEPFKVTTFNAPDRALHEILPNYVPPGSASPSVKRFNPHKIPCLQSLAAFTKTAHHLLAKDVDTRTLDTDTYRLETEHLKNRPNLDGMISTLQKNSPSSFPGWAAVTLWGGLKLKLVSKIYSLRYPRTFGTAYLPPKLVAGLVARVRSKAGQGVVLSRNDIIASWFYKTTCGIYQPGTATTLSRAVNLRGKHYLISPGVSGNVLGLAVMPSVQSGALQKASLEDLALTTRRSVEKFKDPDYVSIFMGFRMNCGNAGRIAIPKVKLGNQRCLITSFVNLGLSNPKFGEGVSVERPVQLTMEPVVIRVIDDARGGWSIHGNLPHAAWDALEKTMKREMEDLDAESQREAIKTCVKAT
ncbi:hypothetical protein FNAPI_2686 [Fusarium napiforme]|uniref:Uncharacterized protein n=1 Tax=Fusarium napiforme TaxID=42672 RepID=A0A8H5JZA7_9HYPO|nr:hypothetical protein FNAPI_2686 [Fusarium napiforme]